MATSVYQYESITLIDGTEIEISPLKIKYLKEFLDKFEDVKGAANDENAIVGLSECARIAMKQFYPSIKTKPFKEKLLSHKNRCVVEQIYAFHSLFANQVFNTLPIFDLKL
jgi:hypothetical protein